MDSGKPFWKGLSKLRYAATMILKQQEKGKYGYENLRAGGHDVDCHDGYCCV